MGPFAPEFIPDQLNLIVALILGIGFGAVLEQAGFSSSRKLAGVFYGYDFTVLRVFFTAAVTAMSGVLLLGYFGYLDLGAIYVNPTWLFPSIVGGAIMGVGFILGGYCPGTSICAMAIGKVDAFFFVIGGIVGVFGFGELFGLYQKFYESTSLGPLRVFDSLGLSQGLFAFILILVAVGAFAITTVIEKRVNKVSAPSLEFKSSKHIFSGAMVLALGVVFVILPDRRTYFINEVNDPSYAAAHPIKTMSPDELAFRIVDRDPSIQVLDLRKPAEFASVSLPGAVNIQINDLFGKDVIPILSKRHLKKVVVAQGESEERTACLLLEKLGYENLAVLEAGYDTFSRTILAGGIVMLPGGRWDKDVSDFRQSARQTIMRMIEEGKKTASKEPKTQKKIQGGC